MLEACVNPGSGKKRSSQQVKRVAHRGPWKTPGPLLVEGVEGGG